MTWDQNSARALRKSLLEDANLRAIISLPQGVFVSKGGQGPKTSILYFEKGEPTRNVWFYKATNDGYSMGTNRKPLAGCQLIEALELFNRYVKKGDIPSETRHSFSIPVEWIKTLDPRIKERIRTETTVELTAKAVEERAKLAETLSKRLADKKISQSEVDERLAQHDQLWKGKISTTIAQKIERAHLYSFNIPNYRSSLAAAQVQLWHEFVRPDSPLNKKVKGGVCSEPPTKYKPMPKTPLDQHYELLKASPPAELDRLLSSLDPRNSLELDMARQFLSTLSPDILAAHPHLRSLCDIITTVAKHPRFKLKEVCRYEKGRFPTQATPEGIYPFVVTAAERKTADDFQFEGNAVCIPLISSSGHGKASMNRIHYQEGKFALANLMFSLFAKDPTELDMKYLYHVLTPKIEELFCPLMKGTANVEMKMEDAVEVMMPLPQLQEQQAIVANIDRQQAIVAGAEMVLENWLIDPLLDMEGDSITLGKLVAVDAKIIKELATVSGRTYVGGENIESGTGRLLKLQTVDDAGIVGPSYGFTKGQIVYSKVRPNLRKCFLANFDGVCSSDIYPYSVISDRIIPQYMAMILVSQYFADMTVQFHERAGMPKVNRDQLATIAVIVPSIEVQEEAVRQYQREIFLLEELRRTIVVTQSSITQTITKIWEH
jgi:restriction endonuclease S subunit